MRSLELARLPTSKFLTVVRVKGQGYYEYVGRLKPMGFEQREGGTFLTPEDLINIAQLMLEAERSTSDVMDVTQTCMVGMYFNDEA